MNGVDTFPPHPRPEFAKLAARGEGRFAQPFAAVSLEVDHEH
jgi:hypothetical protein